MVGGRHVNRQSSPSVIDDRWVVVMVVGCWSVLFVIGHCRSIIIIIGHGCCCGLKKVWSVNSCDQPECRFSKYESLERITYQDLGRTISKAWPGDNERHPSVLSKQAGKHL